MKTPQVFVAAMGLWCVVSLHNAISNAASVFEMAPVPAGKVEAFWLVPQSKKFEQLQEQARQQTLLKKQNLSNKKWIRVSGFQSMTKAVTVEQYQRFLTEKPEWSKGKALALYVDGAYLEVLNEGPVKGSIPITSVSWFAARAFCDYYGMRLPTVNEWEYMAAASEHKKDANRDEAFLARILNWYALPRGETAHKSVGTIYKNLYGLWDLHGLIWEWTEDFNSSFVTGESREDSSFNKDMFCGSGSMSGSNKENYAAFMRFAFRSSLKANASVWNLGFRCVR